MTNHSQPAPLPPATKWTDDHGRQHVTAAQRSEVKRA